MPIDGRIFIPRDVFAILCVEVQHLSDALLKAAQEMQREVAHVPAESQVLNHLLESNVRLGSIESILKIVIDEEPDPTPPLPGAPSGTPPATGGQTCHA